MLKPKHNMLLDRKKFVCYHKTNGSSELFFFVGVEIKQIDNVSRALLTTFP